MNVRDSQWLSGRLFELGYHEAPMESADIILINSCSVREKPERKIGLILERLAALNKNVRLIGVLGCVGQQKGNDLFQIDPRLRLVAGGDSIVQVPEAVATLVQNPEERIALLGFSEKYIERPKDSAPGASSYVNIMQGCDNFCSYCIVPFTRGRQRSREPHAILKECAHRLNEGCLEITLLGQNVNAWGKDAGKGWMFHELLEQVSSLKGLARLRYVSAHPADMTEESLAAFARLENLSPRLHLPLQSGSDRILKAMGRRYLAADFLRLVDKLKKYRPDIALSTDIIVGFPGETDDDFLATLNLLRECGFMSSYSFCYSDRPGTRASLMPDKIANDVKSDRLSRLQATQDELESEWLRKRVGQKTELLLERPSPRGNGNSWQGRDPYGVAVNVELEKKPDTGALIDVEIIESKKHSLFAKKLE